MAWVLLLVAGLLEIVWAFTMKLSQGFTRPGPSIVTLLTMLASFALLSGAMKSLPLGTAYAVWTGIGAVGAFCGRRCDTRRVGRRCAGARGCAHSVGSVSHEGKWSVKVHGLWRSNRVFG